MHNYTKFLKAIDDVKTLLPSKTSIDRDSVLELITLFANTWLSLDAFDKNLLVTQGITKKRARLTAKELMNALSRLKNELIIKGEASELFGIESTLNNIQGIIGNIMQSF